MNAPDSPHSPRRVASGPFPIFRKFFAWFFSCRVLRAGLFVLVCLATLIGLFYAVENWRGPWAWQRFKRELAAKGEPTDWQTFVPPPVPDDQNFAMTPLLRPVLDYERRNTQGYLHVHWRDTNGNQRLQALGLYRPGESINTPSIAADWKAGRKIDLAAWQKYFRWTPPPSKGSPANTTATNFFPVAEQPQSLAADVLLALSRFEPELVELHAASARPFARFPVHYGEGMGTLLPHLATMKRVSQLLTLRAVAELESGRSEQAFLDLKLSLHTAEALKAEPFYISQLVRLSIIDQSMQVVWEGLAAHRWTSNQLVSLMDHLKTIDLLSDHARVVRSEGSMGGFATIFAEPNKGREFLNNLASSGAFSWELIIALDFLPSGWLYLNDLTAARFYRERVLPLINPAERRAYPGKSRAAIHDFNNAPARPGNLIIRAFGLFFAPQKFARGQTDIDLARVACALERYWQVHHQYPETLAALVPDCIEKLPADIITGQPLKYRRNQDGQFILYSVGWNEADDGGAFAEEIESPQSRSFRLNWMMDSEEKGDWVWRYPAGKN